MPIDGTPGANTGVRQSDAATAVVADIYHRIAVAVRCWRHVRHLTQAALGARVGLSAGTIRRIERQQTPVRLNTLGALAEGLDVPAKRLLERLK